MRFVLVCLAVSCCLASGQADAEAPRAYLGFAAGLTAVGPGLGDEFWPGGTMETFVGLVWPDSTTIRLGMHWLVFGLRRGERVSGWGYPGYGGPVDGSMDDTEAIHVTDVRVVYTEYKTLQNMVDRLITPQIYTWSENVFGQFNAVSAVQDRAKLNAELVIALRKVIRGPVAIESVQIENIDFSGKYEEAVEARMEATVRQQQAEAEAAATRTRADASAYAVTAQGNAEASAIRARGAALRDNPGLPGLVTAEKWDGHLPTTMVPGGAVPFLKVSGQ